MACDPSRCVEGANVQQQTEAVVPAPGRTNKRSPAGDTITPDPPLAVPTCTHHTASTETGGPSPYGEAAVPWPATHASVSPTCVPSCTPTHCNQPTVVNTPALVETISYGCESRLRPHPQHRRLHRRRRSGVSSATCLPAYSLLLSLLSSLPLYVLLIFVSVDPKYCISSLVLRVRVLVDPERRHSAMSPLTAAAISAIVCVYVCVVCVCVFIPRGGGGRGGVPWLCVPTKVPAKALSTDMSHVGSLWVAAEH